MRATALALLALCAGSGCVPSRAAPDFRAPVLLATFTDGEEVLGRADRGLRFDNAWAHAAPLRPALASLLTGRTPEQHGLTDPTLHALADPTIADALAAAGWSTQRVVGGADPLHPSESWGFATKGQAGRGARSFTWIHDDPAATEDWLAANLEGHAFLTGLPDGTPVVEGGGGVALAWICPECTPGEVHDEIVGHVDVVATLVDLADIEPLGPGVPLPEGGSDEVVQLEALPRLTVGGPVTRVVRTEDHVQLGPTELPPVHDMVPLDQPIWSDDALPTDPLASAPGGVPRDAVELLRDAHEALSANRLREAREALDHVERRVGITPTGDLLRAELLHREGRPHAALDLLVDRYDRSPSDALAYRIGMAALELREPALAEPWFDRVLENRPGHAAALAARIRCARYRDTSGVDDLHARLWLADPGMAARVQLQMDLDHEIPVDEAMVEGLRTASDPDARLLVARVHWQRGAWREAFEQANAVLAAHPRHIDTRLALATWYLEIDEPEPAVRLIGPVVRWFPDDLRVSTLDAMARDSLAGTRWRLQSLRGGWRGRP
ncbi:MAG: hypothetical protein H6737_29150 [Alphaproteobacteria bacterium]|nr:hypothetical protein [Alphaproteobacteria bacterium]